MRSKSPILTGQALAAASAQLRAAGQYIQAFDRVGNAHWRITRVLKLPGAAGPQQLTFSFPAIASGASRAVA